MYYSNLHIRHVRDVSHHVCQLNNSRKKEHQVSYSLDLFGCHTSGEKQLVYIFDIKITKGQNSLVI